MTTIEMELADLQGLALAMSTEATRYTLNGIHLFCAPGGDMVTATATDGHRLHSVRWIVPPQEEGFNTIIPGYMVDIFLKIHKPGKGIDTFRLHITQWDGKNYIEMMARVAMESISIKSREIEARYPDTSRVIPEMILDARGTKDGMVLNPSYVSDAVMFCAGKKPKTILPIVWQTEGVAVVVGHSAADLAAARDYIAGHTGRVALLMPMRA